MDSYKQTIWIYTVGGLGILLNLLLLYMIATDRAKGGDGYRKMLAIVTVYNIYYAFVHCLADVGFMIDQTGFLMFCKNLHKLGFWYSYIGVLLYVVSFEMSLSLLAIHCLYRYVKISGRFTTLFDRWYGILALTIAHFAGGILYGLSCDFTMKPTPEREMISRDELLFRYNVSIDNLGYIGPVYKLIDETTGESKFLITNMLGSFGCCVMQLTIYWTICAAGMKLYFFVHSALISDKAKAVNFQLLRLLLIQALAPLIFEYIPAMMTIWGGFLGLPLENCAMYIPVLIACYSPTEAIMVIFGFAVYRQRALKMIGISDRGSSTTHNPHSTIKGIRPVTKESLHEKVQTRSDERKSNEGIL